MDALNFFWIDEENPEVSVPNWSKKSIQVWQELFPSWDIKLHLFDRQTVVVFASEHFPDWVDYFSKCRIIEIVDVIRYQWAYLYGGGWSDLDNLPKAPMVDFLNTRKEPFVFFVDALLFKTKDSPIFLGNSLAFSRVRKHPFWLALLELIKLRCDSPSSVPNDVFFKTGPRVFGKAVFDWKEPGDFYLCLAEESDDYYDHLAIGSWMNELGGLK